MFTGLVETIGIVNKIEILDSQKVIEFHCPIFNNSIKADDSIATNGVCLTVTKVLENGYIAEVIETTLQKTTLGELKEGDLVNLERALSFGDRLGGHLVQGHVNTTARVLQFDEIDRNWNLWLEIPTELSRYFVQEGSITIHGVSLTIAKLEKERLMVSLIPHTMNKTVLKSLRPGDRVNIEVDMIAKYLDQLAEPYLKERK